MNCQNCGGVLAPGAAAHLLRCQFCGSTRPIGPDDGPDGLLLTGAQSITGSQGDFGCPRGCGQLMGGIIDGHIVAGCPQCRGFLIDRARFAVLVSDRRRRWTGPDLQPQQLDAAALRRKAPCPGCGTPMETHPYYGPGNSIIDSCRRCEHIWLDAGEIAAIEQAPGRR